MRKVNRKQEAYRQVLLEPLSRANKQWVIILAEREVKLKI